MAAPTVIAPAPGAPGDAPGKGRGLRKRDIVILVVVATVVIVAAVVAVLLVVLGSG